MKISIISDIHGNINALDAVLKHMGTVDEIWCAGDVSGYYYHVNEVLQTLRKKKCLSIIGNHDLYLLKFFGSKKLINEKISSFSIYTRQEYKEKYGLGLEIALKNISPINLQYLMNLKLEQTIHLDNRLVKMFHGSPWDPINEYIYPDFRNWEKFSMIEADIIILGHTHYPMIKEYQNKIIINPGSIGQPRDYDPRASYIKIDTSCWDFSIHRVEFDVGKVVDEINIIEPQNQLIKDVLYRTKGK